MCILDSMVLICPQYVPENVSPISICRGNIFMGHHPTGEIRNFSKKKTKQQKENLLLVDFLLHFRCRWKIWGLFFMMWNETKKPKEIQKKKKKRNLFSHHLPSPPPHHPLFFFFVKKKKKRKLLERLYDRLLLRSWMRDAAKFSIWTQFSFRIDEGGGKADCF